MNVVRVHARSARATLRDRRIPRRERWPLMALAAFGLLPIPGPVDELALALVACVIAFRWPHIYREHLAAARGQS